MDDDYEGLDITNEGPEDLDTSNEDEEISKKEAFRLSKELSKGITMFNESGISKINTLVNRNVKKNMNIRIKSYHLQMWLY